MKVFISYAREDAPTARRLCEDLKKVGADPWLDLECLLPGQKFDNEIRNVIGNCDYVFVLLSSNSVHKKGYVQQELKLALAEHEKFPPEKSYLIPVRIEDVNPTDHRLKELHWVDLFPDYEAGLRQLLRLIPPTDMEEEIRVYRSKAVALHQKIPLAGFSTTLRVPLRIEDVFVHLRVVADLRAHGKGSFADAEDAEKALADCGDGLECSVPEAFGTSENWIAVAS